MHADRGGVEFRYVGEFRKTETPKHRWGQGGE